MKLRIASLALLAVVLASRVEARSQEPKAVDTPYVRPKIDDAHKFGHHGGRHRYRSIEWGSEWKQVFRFHQIVQGHYNKIH